MQNVLTMDAEVASAQQREKLLWLWLPTALGVAAGFVLFRVEPRWSLLALAAAGLWMVLSALAFGIREGVTWAGASLMGYGPDLRAVGLFASYRRPRAPLALAGIHAAMLALGGLASWRRPDDPVEAGFLLMGPLFVVATLPVELCNFWLSRRRGDRPTLRQALALWVPAVLAGQLAGWLALDFIDAALPDVIGAMHRMGLVVVGFAYLFLLVGLHLTTLRWQSRIDQADRRAEVADTARRLAEAQLAVLQAQIEPHFLFNTLATVQYLLKGEPAMADFLLTQLIRYLRLAMPSMRQYSSTLKREFELTDAFLQISRLRMGGRLDVDLDLAVALEEVEFPPLVLQTLAENAIKHGVEPKAGPVRIRILARRTPNELLVSVQDDGVGLGGAATQGGGTGLQNIRERLHGIYGDRAHLTIAGLPQGGVLASVAIAFPTQ